MDLPLATIIETLIGVSTPPLTILGRVWPLCSSHSIADDIEHGDLEKSKNMLATIKPYGLIPISMKDDFVTIYGDCVKKTPAN